MAEFPTAQIIDNIYKQHENIILEAGEKATVYGVGIADAQLAGVTSRSGSEAVADVINETRTAAPTTNPFSSWNMLSQVQKTDEQRRQNVIAQEQQALQQRQAQEQYEREQEEIRRQQEEEERRKEEEAKKDNSPDIVDAMVATAVLATSPAVATAIVLGDHTLQNEEIIRLYNLSKELGINVDDQHFIDGDKAGFLRPDIERRITDEDKYRTFAAEYLKDHPFENEADAREAFEEEEYGITMPMPKF